MTVPDPQSLLTKELGRIAPDIDITEIDRTADLRDEFDIDSMDFLNLVTALSQSLNFNIPEVDYEQMDTFDNLVGYLKGRLASSN